MNTPHLVFIFSDQQHHRAWGRRDAFFSTPNMDAFAAEALDCSRVYCTTPLCSPSRATLMTGRTPQQNGVIRNGVAMQEETIAVRLQQAGYRTAYFGKWHLRDEAVATRGWDVQQGVCDEYRKPNRPLSDAETLQFALEHIASLDPEGPPTATFISFDDPHGHYAFDPQTGYPKDHCHVPEKADPQTPLPPTWEEPIAHPALAVAPDAGGGATMATMYEDTAEHYRRYRETYAGCVQTYDQRLGHLLRALRDRGIYDDSMIAISSDHGDMDAQHHAVFKGHFNYEAVQRVPLLLRAPNSWQDAPRGVICDDLVSLLDLPATLCDAAGAPLATAGISLLPLLTGKASEHSRQETVVAYHHQKGDPSLWSRSYLRGNWKYVRVSDGREALLDVDADPHERSDRSQDPVCAERLQTMRDGLQAWALAQDDHWVLEQEVVA